MIFASRLCQKCVAQLHDLQRFVCLDGGDLGVKELQDRPHQSTKEIRADRRIACFSVCILCGNRIGHFLRENNRHPRAACGFPAQKVLRTLAFHPHALHRLIQHLGNHLQRVDQILRQIATAVGQCELMYTYDKLFGEYNHTVAQLLITGEDIRSHQRHENFSNTLNRLLELGAMPIINENDTVSTDEIVIGDNDTLAAYVAESVKAELLILLSDIDGLYTADPHKDPNATLIPVIKELTDEIYALAGASSTKQGTGGMVTKLRAAAISTEAGCDMVIANGKNPEGLYDILDGKPIGTRFIGR